MQEMIEHEMPSGTAARALGDLAIALQIKTLQAELARAGVFEGAHHRLVHLPETVLECAGPARTAMLMATRDSYAGVLQRQRGRRQRKRTLLNLVPFAIGLIAPASLLLLVS